MPPCAGSPVILLAACAGASALRTADPPASNDLSGLIGQPAPGWKLEHWFNSEPLALQDPRGKVVLVRWFMAPSCPFCSATTPHVTDHAAPIDEEADARPRLLVAVEPPALQGLPVGVHGHGKAELVVLDIAAHGLDIERLGVLVVGPEVSTKSTAAAAWS